MRRTRRPLRERLRRPHKGDNNDKTNERGASLLKFVPYSCVNATFFRRTQLYFQGFYGEDKHFHLVDSEAPRY